MEIDTRNIEIIEKDVVKILKTKTPEQKVSSPSIRDFL